MKKIAFVTVAILALMLAALFASCSDKTAPEPFVEDSYADLYPSASANVTSSDIGVSTVQQDGATCEYNRFYEFYADANADYTFSMIKESGKAVDNLKWYVYILDERYTGSLRYLYESGNPNLTVALDDPQTASVASGQYIYCFCSYNEYTAESGREAGAHLTVKRGGVQ